MSKAFEEIEKDLDYLGATDWGEKPWGQIKRSRKKKKQRRNRSERHKTKQNPERFDEYKVNLGWEW